MTALELPQVASHHAALVWLTELFEEQASPATISAILREVLKGADLEQLQRMVALRDVWAQTPDWWRTRRFCPLRRRFVFTRGGTGAAPLSWALAARVTAARDMYPPELMIDPNWYTEWLTLERHHSFGTFARYVAWRIDQRWFDHEGFMADDSMELVDDHSVNIQRIAGRAQSLADLLEERPQRQDGSLAP
jgi:hypothetical protein